MNHIPKYGFPVRIDLSGESQSVLGVVYVRQDQRVVDMLCDGRAFFPVSTKEGLFVINKSAVTKVSVLEREKVIPNLDLFPELDLTVLDRR